MFGLIVAFLAGCLFTVVVVGAGVLGWLYSQSKPVKKGEEEEEKPYISPQLPQPLQDLMSGDEGRLPQDEPETCLWFNLIVAFLFQELRDSMVMKGIMLKKIKKEFEDVMLTKTEGRMIEQLMVRDYFFGTSMPIIHNAKIVRVEGGTVQTPEIQEMDINLKVEYVGKCQVAIDADLVFDKAAYVAVELSKLKGEGRLRFSRKKGATWSFAFLEDPYMELKVNSHFEGRRYPQLSSIIESQIRKWVKKKHTLPAHKIRYKPFFRKFKPQNQFLDVYVHDQKLTVGKLSVYVLECSRLPEVDGACSVYCTVSVGSSPRQPSVLLWKTQWPVHEFAVYGDASDDTIGVQYKAVRHQDESDQSGMIVVTKVVSPSPACTAGVKKGDVLTRVNNVKLTSVKQTRRLMKRFKETNSILITVQRPPAHFTAQMLETLPSSSSSPSSSRRRRSAGAYVSSTDSTDGNTASNFPASESPVNITLESLDLPGAGREAAGGSGSAPPPSSSRLRSHTTATASSTLTSSLVYTPISSEDERDGVTFSRPGVRKRQMESDAVSLCDVGGERLRSKSTLVGRQHAPHSPVGDPPERSSTPTSIPPRQPPLARATPSTVAPDSPTVAPADRTDASSMAEGASTSGRVREGSTMGRSRDEHVEQKTKEVRAGKNPVWNYKMKFNINESHCYLNICVWERLTDGRGNLLIGHVTIPLMDVAMECLHTNSSTHHQRYVLVQAQSTRAVASRSAVQATSKAAQKESSTKKSSLMKQEAFVGDILLKFKHFPKMAEPSLEKKPPTVNSVESPTTASPTELEEQVDLASLNLDDRHSNLHGHEFVATEHNGIPKCGICQKKIWTLKSRVYKCRRCGLKCHKKCMPYGMRNVRCSRREGGEEVGRDVLADRDEEDGVHVVAEPKKTVLKKRDSGDSSLHRHLDQFREDQRKFSESFEELCPSPEDLRQDDGSGYSTADDLSFDVEDGEGHVAMESSGQPAEGGEEGIDGDTGDLERLFTPLPDSDVEYSENTSTLVNSQLKWSGHLPPKDRQSAINKRLADLQSEIGRIQEYINSLYEGIKKPLTTSYEKKRLETEIEKHEVKLEPLKLLMNEMMTELAYLSGSNS